MEKHKHLITIDVQYNEVYLELHEDATVREAIESAETNSNHVCVALTPHNALELAKGLIDAAYTGKTFDKPITKSEKYI
jgi:hypothetical protein